LLTLLWADARFGLQQDSQSVLPHSRRNGSLMEPLDILFRQVPEGYEFVGVLLTILGSLGILVILGAWWQR
ncbi:MAG: hypothetical protein J4N72_01105, partial [Chloroflexi bacterium]|nr:hypothetical protein [Chloroflexota bacterium]